MPKNTIKAAANAVDANKAKATVNVETVIKTAKLEGEANDPVCATSLETPKKDPRACAGATSVPRVCMLPEIRLTAR